MLKWWQIWPTYAHFSSTTGWRSASEILTTALLSPAWWNSLGFPQYCPHSATLVHHQTPVSMFCGAAVLLKAISALQQSPVSLSTPEREAPRSVMTLFPCSTDSLIFSCLNGCQFRKGSLISCTGVGDALCLSGVPSWPIRPHPLWLQACWGQSWHTSGAQALIKKRPQKSRVGDSASISSYGTLHPLIKLSENNHNIKTECTS